MFAATIFIARRSGNPDPTERGARTNCHEHKIDKHFNLGRCAFHRGTFERRESATGFRG